jgi:hypothetical protein
MSELKTRPELLPIRPVERVVRSDEERNRPIWELIGERVETIPEGELEPMPPDGAVNHDHYLYGALRGPRGQGLQYD